MAAAAAAVAEHSSIQLYHHVNKGENGEIDDDDRKIL